MRRALLAAVLALSLAPGGAAAADFSLQTPASALASRTDRRPLAGGVHDRAVKTTFISWSGQFADTYVQAYDHAAGTWSAPKRLAGGESDSHNYPTMVQAADGHLLIVRGMHNSRTVVSRSPRPHSLEGDWTHTEVPEGDAASYPMPIVLKDGTLIVFYRETTREIDPSAPSDFRPIKYILSRDDGRTWQGSEELTGQPFALGSTSRADHMDEIYIGQARYDRRANRIHLVYTLAGGGPGQHVHDHFHRNIYHASFDPETLTFSSAAGRDLGTQVDDAEQERYLEVVETPLVRPASLKSPDYIQQVGWLPGGAPFVLWFEFDETGTALNRLAVWNGRRWVPRQVATGLRTREVEPVLPGVWRAYATRDDQPSIETFLVIAGRIWRPETVIATPKPVQRIETVTSFADPIRILATGASSARDVAIADGDIYVAGLAP
jgi:hypothetical protein